MTQSFFVLQGSQSSQTPSMSWGGSPTISATPMWPPPPPVAFWTPLGPGFWHPPPQLYPGQPFSTPLPQTGQGYLSSSMSWGAQPRGQASSPFGSPLLRTPHRSTIFTPPVVRQAYAKIGFVCLLDLFALLTC
jgi:hypothetical protein